MKIGCGLFGTIYAGNTRKDSKGRETWTKKTDVTDMCISAVFEWFMQQSQEEEGRAFVISFKGHGTLTYDPKGILEDKQEGDK